MTHDRPIPPWPRDITGANGSETRATVAEVIRVISAIFLRETLEAANNDAEMQVQDSAQFLSR